MAEGKSKTGVVKKRASKREKKIGLRRIYLLHPLPWAFWCLYLAIYPEYLV